MVYIPFFKNSITPLPALSNIFRIHAVPSHFHKNPLHYYHLAVYVYTVETISVPQVSIFNPSTRFSSLPFCAICPLVFSFIILSFV